MKIQKLTLENFKGMKSFCLDLKGKSARIYGKNAAGKSTLADSVQWLLFGKDSAGNANFGVKTRDDAGEEIPMIDHSVEGVLTIDDGQNVTLKRTFKEKWVRKRGRTEQEFEGHETIYEINGVPKKKKDYEDFIASIAPESWFRLITSPTYFNENLTWQQRRELLIDTCGDVKDGDVILANLDRLEELGALVKDVSIDDLRKMKASERQKINKELTDIPGRIDEAMKAMPDITGNAESLTDQARKIAGEISTLNAEKIALQNGGSVQKLQQRIAEIDTYIAQARAEHANAIPDVSEERKQIANLQTELARLVGYDISALQQRERELSELSQKLGDRWKAEKATVFVRNGICPKCKQDYPENMLDVMEAEFNSAKSINLETIAKDGQSAAKNLADVREKIAMAQNANLAQEDRKQVIAKEIAKLESLIASKIDAPAFETLPEYLELCEQKKSVQDELQTAKNASSISTSGVDKQIEEKQSSLGDINRQITLIDTANTQQARIKELKAKQKDLAANFEKAERVLNMIDIFEQERASMLDDAISGKFELVRFKLTNQLINGGVEPACVCTVGGVPYPDLNNAMKIAAGCDLIRTISREKGVAAPLFIDNAESICDIPKMDCQVVELIVSRDHDELLVELVG